MINRMLEVTIGSIIILFYVVTFPYWIWHDNKISKG